MGRMSQIGKLIVFAAVGVVAAIFAVHFISNFFNNGEAPVTQTNDNSKLQKEDENMDPALSGVEWVHVDGGTFSMGREDSSIDERPVHKVTISSFSIARTETTVGQYGLCVSAGVCTPGKTSVHCNGGKKAKADHPMNCVSWDQANTFCRWIGGRLPTEAEWERSARYPDGRLYPWGSEMPSCELATINQGGVGCGERGTAPVCSHTKGRSAMRLCDMVGNVWEWCSDFYLKHYYENSPSENPKGPAPNDAHSIRGGSFVNEPKWVSNTDRDRNGVHQQLTVVGFRCARDE